MCIKCLLYKIIWILLSTMFVYRLFHQWIILVVSWFMCHMHVLFIFNISRRCKENLSIWDKCKWWNCAAATCRYLDFSSHSFSNIKHCLVTMVYCKASWKHITTLPIEMFLLVRLIRLTIFVFLQSVSLFVISGSLEMACRGQAYSVHIFHLYYNELLLQKHILKIFVNIKDPLTHLILQK